VRACLVAGAQHGGGGDVAAGAATGHGDACPVAAEFGRVGGDPEQGGVGVVGRGGVGVFGGEAVVDGYDDGPGVAGVAQGASLLGLGGSVGEGAAVDVEDHGQDFGGVGPVDAQPQVSPCGTGDVQVPHRDLVVGGGVGVGAQECVALGVGEDGVEAVDGEDTGVGGLQQGLDLGVDCGDGHGWMAPSGCGPGRARCWCAELISVSADLQRRRSGPGATI
jgi:hypothetical protein